jgi:hypothetical protein
MKFISEQTIDEAIQALNASDEALEKAEALFMSSQPHILAFITQEDLSALTEEEQDYLFVLTLTAWDAAQRAGIVIPLVSEDELGEAEEANYALLEKASGTQFKARMDVFFEAYPQEDLLAFIEDSLIDDEDDIVTKEGRETLFVTLKSVVDAMHASASE